jgi:hypothetical protein
VDKTQRLQQGMPQLGDFNKFYGGAMAGVRCRLIVAGWPTFAGSYAADYDLTCHHAQVTHTLRFPTLPATTTSGGHCSDPPASLRHLCDQLVMPAGGGNNLHFLSLSRTLCMEQQQPLEAKRLVEQLWTSSSLTWWPTNDDCGAGRTLGSFSHFQIPRSAANRRAAHPVADAIAAEILALHSAQTVDQADADLQQRRGFTFGDLHRGAVQPWSEVRVAHDSAAWPAMRVTGTLVEHSTTITRPLNNINRMFDVLFKRKAFLSWSSSPSCRC